MAKWQPAGGVRRRKSVTLDASGNGSVDFDVFSANHLWKILGVVVNTNQAQTATPYPVATVYIGGQQVGVSEGASWVGPQDTLHGEVDMTAADTLTVAFSGGIAGTIGTVIIEGASYLWR